MESDKSADFGKWANSILASKNETRQKRVHTGAKASLIILILSILFQFLTLYQTARQLNSPLIPKSLFWDIGKQYIFVAFVLTAACLPCLILYFYKRYLAVIVVVTVILIISRFIYLPE